MILESHGSPIFSKDDQAIEASLKDSSSVIINAPIPKKGTLEPIELFKN